MLAFGLAPLPGAEILGLSVSHAAEPSLNPGEPLPVDAGSKGAGTPLPGEAAPGAPVAPVAAAPKAPAKPFVLASDLFSTTLASARATDVRMGGDYVIGSGDQVAITTFGSVSLSKVLEVDRGGKLTIPDVGIVDVQGLPLAAARTVVRLALQRKHAGLEQFNMEVVGLHDVEVYVIGEVPRPGSYLVPSAMSPVTLLGLAGGIGENGSYRTIQHIRSGKVIHALDLYRLRFDGKGLEALGFQDGDTLFVPLAKVRVNAVGAFRRVAALGAPLGAEVEPGVLLELAPGEGALEALRFAGGLIPSASQIYLTLQRTSPGGITTIRNIRNTKADLKASGLCEGDVLRALPRVEREEEFVEAAGFVAVPGRFSYTPGMRVKDLLTLGGEGDQLLPGTYRLRGEILRTRPDGRTRLLRFDVERALRGEPGSNLELQARDRVELGNVADLRLPKRVTLLGPFTRPGIFDWHEDMRASDLIYRAGVPRLSADGHYAELAHIREGRTSDVVRLDLSRLLSTETSAPLALEDDAVNPRLRPYDQITVYENPDFRMHRTVSISGQVQRPGPYVIQEDHFSLRQLIQRAGGLTPDAMPSGGVFLRTGLGARDLSAPNPEASAGPDASANPVAGFKEINEILQRLNETKRNKDTGALLPNPLLHGLLAGSLNRLVVDFPAVLKGDPRQDVTLQDGDQVFIPRQLDSAYVVGEVASPFASFHVKRGDRVEDVLKLAGGYTRNADKSQVRLLKAGGKIIDSRVEGAGIEPGDALLVPQRFRKDVAWQDTLIALTPLALLYNAIRH